LACGIHKNEGDQGVGQKNEQQSAQKEELGILFDPQKPPTCSILLTLEQTKPRLSEENNHERQR
jgi:hypothetical protein